MLNRWVGRIAAVVVLALGGCAVPVQKPVSLPSDFFSSGPAKSGPVGVVMMEMPAPDTQFPGAGCLLCIGVANAAHAQLTDQVKTFSVDEVKALRAEAVALLKKKGLDAREIAEMPKPSDFPDLPAVEGVNRSRKDYTALGQKHGVQRLLVIRVTALGVWRSYSAYVPTDVPRATVMGEVAMVQLGTHTLEWLAPIRTARAAEGNWDEPPKFPGLTNAYYQAIESAKDLVLKPLSP